MAFDRFDICEAWYLYMTEYHTGQESKEYRLTGVFAKLRFRPPFGLDYNALTENGKIIFDNLVLSNGGKIRDRR